METKTIECEGNTLNNSGLPENLTNLRNKLFQKAKQEKEFRFYTLYDHIVKETTLKAAWSRVKENKGSSGIDGINFEDIEKAAGGVEGYLKELGTKLKDRKYKSQAVKRVYIPKSDGRKRPLGIPTIRDRIVQMAVLLIIEPIFEADFVESSYGFRPKRSGHDAIEKIESHLKEGKRVVYDADLKGYFDTIPHDKLIKALERRLADKSIIKLIKMWLTSAVIERDEKGKMLGHRPKQGTPQGGVISPLLANIYLHHFEKVVEKAKSQGYEISMVRYADDFVIMMKKPMKGLIEKLEEILETKFGLTINREKTKWVDLRERGITLDFLGYTFRYEKSVRYKRLCLSIFASRKSEKKIKETLGAILDNKNSYQPIERVVKKVNKIIIGWSNYFSKGYKKKVYSRVNHHLNYKFWKFCSRKSQRKMKLPFGTKSWHEFGKSKGLKFLSYAK